MRILLKTQWVAIFYISCSTAWGAESKDVEEIEVQGTAPEEIAPGDVPLGIRFSGEELQRVPGAGGDVLRGIQSLPGIAVNNDADGEVAIRGSRPENNRYYVDFMPSGYLFHFTGTSVIPGDLVKQFDLYPAGYGAAYQGSIGGILDVKTRDPSLERQGQIDISLLDAGILYEGEVNDTQSAFFAARVSYYDLIAEDFIDNDEDDFEIVQLPKFFDYRGKYLWELDGGQRLQFYLDGADDRAEFVLGDNADEVLQDPVSAGRYAFNLRYHRQAATLEGATESGNVYQLGLSNRFSKTTVLEGGAGNIDLNVATTTLKSELELAATGAHQISLGATLENVSADYDVRYRDTRCTEFDVDCRSSDAIEKSADNSLSVLQAAVFAEDRIALGDSTTLILGLGVNGDDYLDEQHVEPRIRLEKQMENNLLLSAAVGKYHDFPQFEQVEKTFGNPDLEYQEADHYVIGISQEAKNGWFWKAETYYKKMTKLVTSDSEKNYLNLGEGSAQGVELLIKKDSLGPWSGWLSFSWSESERKDLRSGRAFDFEYDQPVIATLVATRTINPKWTLSSKIKFNSGSPYTPILGGEPDTENTGSFKAIYGEINSERLPDYFRIDIRADYQPRPESWSVFAELLNATAHKNLSGYEYNADFSERKDVEQLPLLINFGFKIPLS